VTVLRSGSATDVGRVRRINEDIPLEATNLYAVADGMGGHVGGEVAARVAVDALLAGFSREPTRSGLQDAFSRANQAVWQESQDHAELRGMGTTLTAVALVGGEDGKDTLALANVGDSRAYLFTKGQVVQLTADHSLAEERMRQGEISEEEAAVHPQRHILTRVMGASPEVDTDMWELRLRSGDRLVLCSDGLSNEIGQSELAEVLDSVPDPGAAAQRLVELANEHGGADNITVVVVDVLVGEENGGSSVITPLGDRAGAPLIIAGGTAAGAEAAGAAVAGAAVAGGTAAGGTDALERGARLGFTGQVPALGGNGPRSGEFFVGNVATAPVARSTVRTPLTTPQPAPSPAPEGEGRRARRRRLGIPRLITVRVVLFALLVLAVPTGAYFAIRWYAYDNWFLAVQKHQVVIKQGHPGGVLWFHPRVVDRTGVTMAHLLPAGLAEVRSGIQEPSLESAQTYVQNIHRAWVQEQEAKEKAKAAASTTTTTTSTTVIGGTATTVPVGTAATAATAATATTVAP
jgi:PPM family protein phosphatase